MCNVQSFHIHLLHGNRYLWIFRVSVFTTYHSELLLHCQGHIPDDFNVIILSPNHALTSAFHPEATSAFFNSERDNACAARLPSKRIPGNGILMHGGMSAVSAWGLTHLCLTWSWLCIRSGEERPTHLPYSRLKLKQYCIRSQCPVLSQSWATKCNVPILLKRMHFIRKRTKHSQYSDTFHGYHFHLLSWFCSPPQNYLIALLIYFSLNVF